MPNTITPFIAPYSEAKIQKWKLPEYKEISPEKGVFRNITLKWSELSLESKNGIEVPIYYICCDILELDEMVNLTTTTLIFARSIRLSKGAGITQIAFESPISCLIASQEIVDADTGKAVSLPVYYLDSKQEEQQYNFEVAPVGKPLQVFEWEQAASSFISPYPISQLDSAFFIEGEPVQIYLRTLFQVATLLLDEDTDLSIKQLSFVAALSQANKNTRSIGGEALGLASTIKSIRLAEQGYALLVPQLDHRLYAESAKNCIELLRDRQTQWKDIQKNITDIEKWRDSVSDLLEIRDEELALNQQLLQKAKKTRQQVLNARSIAGQQLVEAQVRLIWLQEAFKAGVEIYKIDQTLAGIKDIIFGILQILAEIPNIITAVPGIATQALDGVNALVSDVGSAEELGAVIVTAMGGTDFKPNTYYRFEPTKLDYDDFFDSDLGISGYIDDLEAQNQSRRESETKVAETQTRVNAEIRKRFHDSIGKVQKGATSIFDGVSNIIKITKQAEKMKRESERAMMQTNDAISSVFSSNAVQGLDIIDGGARVWDELLLAIDNFFEAVPKAVKGRNEYLDQIRSLIIVGKVYSESRLALADANSKRAEMKMRHESAKKAVRIYEQRKIKLQKQAQKDATIAQLIFGRVLDAKRAVYLAIEAYRRGFQYHTLSEPIALPKLSDSMDDFVSKVTQISGKLLDVTSLNVSPDTMEEATVPVTSLAPDFKHQGEFNFYIEPNSRAFNKMYRIRLKEVRVFLDGLKTDKEIIVSIDSSPEFKDKTSDGAIKSFISKPVHKIFKYKPASEKITSSTAVAPRYSDDFFQPTPFTTWTIKITDDEDNVPDLSEVTNVRFVFIGYNTPMPRSI